MGSNAQDKGIQAGDIQTAKDLRGYSPEEIAGLMTEMGEPAYRGGQIFSWLHRDAAAYRQMTSLSLELRRRLEEAYPLTGIMLRRRQESADGTKKYLFSLEDDSLIESVLMYHKEDTGHIRHTVCLSCQVGCAMGCGFCSTADLGFRRNLTAGEIVAQVLEIARTEDIVIHNAVYMGMGEPMYNEEAVRKSILLLNHPLGQNIGVRRITVSTCGLPEGIRSMARWGAGLVLAVSLHAADDRTRDMLMPVNKRFPLAELTAACRHYCGVTGKRITFEYVMIDGVNMGGDTAAKLERLLRGIPCNINLIPVNPGVNHYPCPGRPAQQRFLRELKEAGFEAVIRQERGQDIRGACGQLAADAG